MFFSFISNSYTIAQDKLPKLIKKMQPSIVSIITYDKDKEPLSSGTGFFINKQGNMITNHHVLEDAYSAEVKTYDGHTYKILKIVAVNKKADIIMATVNVPGKVDYLKLSTALPLVGSKVFVIGNPKGFDHTVSDGIISSLRIDSDYGQVIQITAPISPGSSGSPVINMKGEVIGVATYYYSEGQNLNFSIPSIKIKELKPVQNFSLAKWQEIKDFKQDEILMVLLKDGERFLTQEKYVNALAAFISVNGQLPNVPEVSFLIGVCYQNLERFNDAIDSYKIAIELNPEYGEAYLKLAEIYFKQEKLKKAIKFCDKAIELNKEYSEAYYLRGSIKAALGDVTGSDSDYKIAKEIAPKSTVNQADKMKDLMKNKRKPTSKITDKLKSNLHKNDK
jgi:hypothetical protein